MICVLTTIKVLPHVSLPKKKKKFYSAVLVASAVELLVFFLSFNFA